MINPNNIAFILHSAYKPSNGYDNLVDKTLSIVLLRLLLEKQIFLANKQQELGWILKDREKEYYWKEEQIRKKHERLKHEILFYQKVKRPITAD